jgi:AcrR family transcriptional regulator
MAAPAAAAARVLTLALSERGEAAPDPAAERMLDAALELADASGLRNLTMEDVARRAGAGRMTVYRRFGSRAALIDALAVRECRRCLAQIASASPPEAPLVDRLAAQGAVTLRLIGEHPLLARVSRFEPEALIRELTRDGSAVLELVRAFMAWQLRDAELPAGADPELVAELAIRLAASFVLIPETVLPLADEDATRARLRAVLSPLLA